MPDPTMLEGREPLPDPVQFREEDHHLRFIGWTEPKGQKHPIPWYECADCGKTFSEAYPTIMPPVTDCPVRTGNGEAVA